VTKSTLITARIDPELKQETEKVFEELGLTMTQAITLFFKQVKMRQGLPFAVAIPNAKTRQALDDALSGKNLHKAESVDSLFDELGA
jgi:DNA-damage-inducible protein J